MTQFEFVSVAQSLLCSLIAIRIFSGFVGMHKTIQSYFVYTVWIALASVAVTINWWIFWSFRDVDWTYINFLIALSPTFFFYLQAAVLVPTDRSSVTSWRDYFYEIKNAFFSFLYFYSLAVAATSYFLLDRPILDARRLINLYMLAVAATGYLSNNHRVQVAVVVLWSLLISVGVVGLMSLDLN